VGICTGNLFTGIVGHEGGRKEVAILGEAIEKAFLFTYVATKHRGKIYVDFETKKEASSFLDFEYKEHIEFSNKYLSSPIFEAVDFFQEWYESKPGKKAIDMRKIIRIHSMPFYYDLNNEFVDKYSTVIGSDNVVDSVIEDLKCYVRDPTDIVQTLAIKGPPGSGKSLFARNLIEEVKRREAAIFKLDKKGEGPAEYIKKSFHFLPTTCNAEIAMLFMGPWRPILRELLFLWARVSNKKEELILNNLIKGSDVDDKVAIVEEVFGISGLNRTKM